MTVTSCPSPTIVAQVLRQPQIAITADVTSQAVACLHLLLLSQHEPSAARDIICLILPSNQECQSKNSISSHTSHRTATAHNCILLNVYAKTYLPLVGDVSCSQAGVQTKGQEEPSSSMNLSSLCIRMAFGEGNSPLYHHMDKIWGRDCYRFLRLP